MGVEKLISVSKIYWRQLLNLILEGPKNLRIYKLIHKLCRVTDMC